MRTKPQFSEYARLLLKDINETVDRCRADQQRGVLYSTSDIRLEIERTLARRGADFAAHVLRQIPALLNAQSVEEAVGAIPDMGCWPEKDIAEKETVMVPTPAKEAR